MKNLPKDIRHLVTVKFMKKFLFGAAWCSFVSFSLIYSRERIRTTIFTVSDFHVILFSVIIGMIIFLPLIAMKFHHIFTDRNWSGAIIGKSYNTVYPTQAHMNISYSFFSKSGSKETVILEIKTDKGIKHVTYFDNSADADFYYKIGDEVQHYRGLKYLYNKSAANSDTHICLHCGALSSSESTSCNNCRHTLITEKQNNTHVTE